MKIRHLHIENFKGLRSLDHDFTGSDGSPRNLTALIGDNGSGKTTALQAIALVLSMAARRTPSPDKLNWHGFLADRMGSMGKTLVVLTIDFDEEEVRTCKILFEEWQQSLPAAEKQGMRLVPPSEARTVQLHFQDGKLTSPDGAQAVSQFAGRYYIGKLAKTRPRFRDDYAKVGSVFWFDQMRNLGQSLSSIKEDENQPVYTETWQSGVVQLRDFLVGWWAHHMSPERGGKDYIPELKTKLNLVFPGLDFAGVRARGAEAGGVSDFYFLLEREGKVFDIAEMSSGEQAVFPLIYEFVRLSIAKSVVLIDEMELHLHPPQQQALLAALRKLGPDCQFIITTHSRFLEGSIPDEHEVRLKGGRPCL